MSLYHVYPSLSILHRFPNRTNSKMWPVAKIPTLIHHLSNLITPSLSVSFIIEHPYNPNTHANLCTSLFITDIAAAAFAFASHKYGRCRLQTRRYRIRSTIGRQRLFAVRSLVGHALEVWPGEAPLSDGRFSSVIYYRHRGSWFTHPTTSRRKWAARNLMDHTTIGHRKPLRMLRIQDVSHPGRSTFSIHNTFLPFSPISAYVSFILACPTGESRWKVIYSLFTTFFTPQIRPCQTPRQAGPEWNFTVFFSGT